MSDNKDEVGGVVTTKLQKIELNPLRRSRIITFEVTEEFLQAIADKDEQAGVYLIELMGELMSELQSYARGEHPRLNSQRAEFKAGESFEPSKEREKVKFDLEKLKALLEIMNKYGIPGGF